MVQPTLSPLPNGPGQRRRFLLIKFQTSAVAGCVWATGTSAYSWPEGISRDSRPDAPPPTPLFCSLLFGLPGQAPSGSSSPPSPQVLRHREALVYI